MADPTPQPSQAQLQLKATSLVPLTSPCSVRASALKTHKSSALHESRTTVGPRALLGLRGLGYASCSPELFKLYRVLVPGGDVGDPLVALLRRGGPQVVLLALD